MKYTREQRKQIAEAFRAARQFVDTREDALRWEKYRQIATGKSTFICHALEKTYLPMAAEAKRIVMARIDPWDVCTDWAMANMDDVLSAADKQEYRHQWLDRLIKEFSE